MKVIIPLAGFGTRLRPHTYTKPKPLISVAGKAVLGHILDKLAGVEMEEIIFILGYLGDQIRDYVAVHYDFPARYLEQADLKGQAHAISLAKEHVSGPVLIIFVDTIFDKSMGSINLAAVAGPNAFFNKGPPGFAIVRKGFGNILEIGSIIGRESKSLAIG